MKKVLVRGPALSQSGYGEHTRFVLRALRLQESELDIHILPTGWGETGWLAIDDEERKWIDSKVTAGAHHLQQNLPYDISIQVTIPNEWQKMAAFNIGVTAGIETNKVSPNWLEMCNTMDKVITISEHSKNSFMTTEYHGQNKQTGAPMHLQCETPIEVIGYPVKQPDLIDVPLVLDYKFNYLAISQWGPRKNMHNLVKWFVEENHDKEVGLIVKTSLKNNSVVDREFIEQVIRQAIPKIDDCKCKVYLLHGDMSESEIHSLYKHPKIKALVSLTHGEGFGLPLFEAAYSGLPIIAPGWSGQTDFLYVPSKSSSKKNKNKLKACFADVDYTIGPIDAGSVWPGVLEENSMWCYPTEGSFKMRLRQVRKNYDKWLNKASELQKWVSQEFEWVKMYKKLSFALHEPDPSMTVDKSSLPKISLVTSVFKAEEYIDQLMEDITRQTIFEDKCEWIILNANKPGDDYEEEVIKKYMKKYPDNIVYKRLEEDPGIYDTWNMGIQMATGDYVTNVNCDDRRSIDGLEKQAKMLFAHPDIDLVYNDSYIVHEPNVMFEDVKPDTQRYNFEQFSKEAMLRGNLPHNNPMWRRAIHEKHGYFNQYYKSAGDWDFWLRCAFGGAKFKKHPDILGVYYFNPTGMSTNPEHDSWKKEHEREIFQNYLNVLQQSA